MKIDTILDQIDMGSIALPEFQRGYVWNREQVRLLMTSLYRGHPVGTLMIWKTKTEGATIRGNTTPPNGTVDLLLDGQQRITTLYGIIRGRKPQFFEGNESAFTDLYFNIEDETFAFYAPLKMHDNAVWVPVTNVMKMGAGEYWETIAIDPSYHGKGYLKRLNNLNNIKDRDFHVETITGEEKTVDVVVEIFNNVNSGGTKLSKGDLALAKICASWPEARQGMNLRLTKWKQAGFSFRMELLLRTINALVTGEAFFSAFKDVDVTQFQDGLVAAEQATDTLLNLISARLGLDHDQVLGSGYSFPVLARYLNQRGGHLHDYRERDRLLYWYVHTFMWGRYAGSTETVLSQDLKLIEDHDGGLDRLIAEVRRSRGNLQVTADDFTGQSKGARFYPLLYMLTRVYHSRDLESGIELSSYLLGKLSRLEVHHIFPRALLYKAGYDKGEVNAIANFTFLTQATNLLISDRSPAMYLAEYAERHPGVLESHWIPTDPALWQIERYRDFLAERRRLLAIATNTFLDGLLHSVSDEFVAPAIMDLPAGTVMPTLTNDGDQYLLDFNEWVTAQGLPEGEMHYDLLDPDTGAELGSLDLAWPNGLQEGYSMPVALINEYADESLEVASKVGYRCFRSIDELRGYIEHEILART